MGLKVNQFGIVATTLLLASLSVGSTSTTKQQSSNSDVKAQKSSHAVHRVSKRTRRTRARGQKAIDGERVRQIQEALIREHYLKGEPSGQWDASTQQAMHRFQADQGWQSKTVPDSRALIRLGLGPDHEHLLNPESAMTMSSAPTAHVASRSSAKASAPATTAAGTSLPASSAQVSSPSTIPAR